jgi:hypothetical protein
VVHFKNYIGPQFFDEPEKHNWIPISPITIYSKVALASRTMYPLRLCYALTSHKTQGETLTKGIIDLGNNEKNLGTTFVQLSRFRSIDDFLIKPFPFDRLTKIALSKSLAPRIKEESRLQTLYMQTKINFKHLMPK